MSQQAPAASLADDATPAESHGTENCRDRPRTIGEGRLLAALAEIDGLLRERATAWRGLVRRLDALRREIPVVSAQLQRSRSLAARRSSQDDEAGRGANPLGPARDEARCERLMREFEGALRETEERRVALQAETERLRHRREAVLRRLPASIRDAYQSLSDAGRMPAIAAVANGACGACRSRLPASVIETLGHGVVAVCTRCERLLHSAKGIN